MATSTFKICASPGSIASRQQGNDSIMPNVKQSVVGYGNIVTFFFNILVAILLKSCSSWSSIIMSSNTPAVLATSNNRQRPINVIIIGGSSGMGKALATKVVRSGGRVLIASRDVDKLKRASNEILENSIYEGEQQGENHVNHHENGNSVAGTVMIATLDASNEEAVKSFASDVSSGKYGELTTGEWDGLAVTAAGRAPHGPVLSLPTSDTRSLFDTKFWSAYHCAKHLCPLLRSPGSGVVFTAGILNRRPGINCAPLAATNGALEGLTRALALELGSTRGIRVNCLSPGFCNTERFDHMDPDKRTAMLKNTADSLPLGRVGQPEDMGDALFYLLTAPFTTGTILDCDGGHGIRQYASSKTDPMRKEENSQD